MIKLDHFFDKKFFIHLGSETPQTETHPSRVKFIFRLSNRKKIKLSDHISPILTNFAQTSNYVVDYNSRSMYSTRSKKFPNYVCKYIKFFGKIREIQKF